LAQSALLPLPPPVAIATREGLDGALDLVAYDFSCVRQFVDPREPSRVKVSPDWTTAAAALVVVGGVTGCGEDERDKRGEGEGGGTT
jgi:hypothetical protein